MHLSIIGPGRLGSSLAQLLREAGWRIDLLGRRDRYDLATPIVLTVPDHAITLVASCISVGNIVLHTSGATDVNPLRPHRPAGSFHPLMTFPGPDVAIPPLLDVPAALAGDTSAIQLGRDIAAALGMRPFAVPGDRRLYHASAVIAGNFATVLLAEASEVLIAAGVPRSRASNILAPLALASLRNASINPATAITGPAARGDQHVLAEHRAALTEAGLGHIVALYDDLSNRASALALSNHSVSGRPEE
jgi:predicted short-subunit dehydrogenase-like oxidoreductase (DUF2520 family)